MLEECIDIDKAKQNDYIINPNFSPELKDINEQISNVKRQIEIHRKETEQDLKVNKNINVVENQLHTFVFEVDKQ